MGFAFDVSSGGNEKVRLPSRTSKLSSAGEGRQSPVGNIDSLYLGVRLELAQTGSFPSVNKENFLFVNFVSVPI